MTAGYYLPLDICLQVEDPSKNGLYHGSWSESSSTDSSTNAIELTKYSKGKCRGKSSMGRTDTGPSTCLPYFASGVNTGRYIKSFIAKEIPSDVIGSGVLINLYKDKKSCTQLRPEYQLAEQAFAGINQCFPAAGFAGGYDVMFLQCSNFNFVYYNVYASNDGSCTGFLDTVYFKYSKTCKDQVSVSGHTYGFASFMCYIE